VRRRDEKKAVRNNKRIKKLIIVKIEYKIAAHHPPRLFMQPKDAKKKKERYMKP